MIRYTKLSVVFTTHYTTHATSTALEQASQIVEDRDEPREVDLIRPGRGEVHQLGSAVWLRIELIAPPSGMPTFLLNLYVHLGGGNHLLHNQHLYHRTP